MASKATGNNCPTSDRDGACVQPEVARQAVREIEATNGHPFMPDANDRARMGKATVDNDIFGSRFDEITELFKDADGADDEAEFAGRISLDDLEGPTAEDLAAIEAA